MIFDATWSSHHSVCDNAFSAFVEDDGVEKRFGAAVKIPWIGSAGWVLWIDTLKSRSSAAVTGFVGGGVPLRQRFKIAPIRAVLNSEAE